VAGFLNGRSAGDVEPRRIVDAFASFHAAAREGASDLEPDTGLVAAGRAPSG